MQAMSVISADQCSKNTSDFEGMQISGAAIAFERLCTTDLYHVPQSIQPLSRAQLVKPETGCCVILAFIMDGPLGFGS
jgi:hypothetical protein